MYASQYRSQPPVDFGRDLNNAEGLLQKYSEVGTVYFRFIVKILGD